MRLHLESAPVLAAVLRGVVAEMQHASKANVASIFLCEEARRTH
jgi:hypothetical protein